MVLVPDIRPARDEPSVRVALARAHAVVGSARSNVYDTVDEFWDALVAGVEPSHRQRAQLAGCHLHSARSCRHAVELVAEVVGTKTIRRTCPLERHRRDLATINHHLTAQRRLLEITGGLWLTGAHIDHPLLDQQAF